MIELRILSSLSKVFSSIELKDKAYKKASALKGEVFSFQCAFIHRSPENRKRRVDVKINSAFGDKLGYRVVREVPADFPCYQGHDKNIISSKPGLYPDLLENPDAHNLFSIPGRWSSLWFELKVPEDFKPGKYQIDIELSMDGDGSASASFELEIVNAVLPPQKLLHTEWFHTDCIASYYKCEIFSERHWELIENFMLAAVRSGINMILTPIFTPPLDTARGGERPTVQLIGVQKKAESYSFDFSLLERWIKLARKCGIKYFEFSHLATQWGAEHCPKIVATENGVEKRIFGWDSSSTGEAYCTFLAQLLPALAAFIRKEGIAGQSFFHTSDEPSLQHLETYKKVSGILREHLRGFRFMDALSNYEFYGSGALDIAIPASNHIEPFLANKVPELWTYYCCSQYKEVANRFFNMPSARNRIIGQQLFKFNIAGFLHWGFNFYYSQYSLREIDPFRVTDAECAFPAGDTFLVYPGKEGALESIRGRVFFEALQDLRALSLLEEKAGRDAALALLDPEMSFSKYPKEASYILKSREKLNRLLKKFS